MRCIYTEKVCSWEVVGPMEGEWLKEVDTSSVQWRGGKRVYKSCCSEITVLRLGWLGALCHATYFILCKSVHRQNDRCGCLKNLNAPYELPLADLHVTVQYAPISSQQTLWRISLYKGSSELY